MNQNLNYQDFAESFENEELITGEAVSLSVQPTSFVMRALGTLIDAAVSIAVLVLLLTIGFRLALNMVFDNASFQAYVILSFVFSLVIVPMTVETLTRGRSLGKLAVGARIVRNDGGSIQLRHAMIRALVGVFEIFMTAGGGAAIAGLVSNKTQRLGDLLAGTYSQYERSPNPYRAPELLMAPYLEPWAAQVDIGKVSPVILRRINNFLHNAARMMPAARQHHASILLSEVTPYLSFLPDAANPDDILAAVAVLRRRRDQRYLELNRSRVDSLEPILSSNPHQFPRQYPAYSVATFAAPTHTPFQSQTPPIPPTPPVHQ